MYFEGGDGLGFGLVGGWGLAGREGRGKVGPVSAHTLVTNSVYRNVWLCGGYTISIHHLQWL